MAKTEIIQKFIKKSLAASLVMSAAAFAYAQQKSTVSGTIVDAQGQAVPYASINFSSKANMLYSDAALTDERGNYTVELVPGDYKITVEAIDFQTFTADRSIRGGRLENIALTAESSGSTLKTQEIEGVTITATTRPYRVELDKKTYDPSADIVSKGGTLQDVLNNVPSVSVETDGTVSMRGSSNVRFLINGKPSALLGIEDGASALQSIPADQIERIEVITNPSSKFEASGTAGILNIILKKTKRTGFNGSVTGSIGYLPQTSLNTNLGWRRGNLSWFINGGGGYRESEGRNDYEINYKNVTANGQLYQRNQYTLSKNEMRNYNASTGLVYDFNERTSANISGTVRTYETEGDGLQTRNDYLLNSSAVLFYRNDLSLGNNVALQGDFGLDHKFDDKGQVLALSASLQRNRSNGSSDISESANNIIRSDEDLAQKSTTKSFVGKADYEKPLGEKSKIEAGYRFDLNNNNYENDLVFNVIDPLNAPPPAALFNNNTHYKETFNAAYIQFKSSIGDKLGYQLGLRDEYSIVDIDYRNAAGQTLVKTKKYNNIFPSVFLSYEVGTGSQFLVNYSRRIDRPRSFWMVPYGRYSNPFTLFEGNIDLDPSYVDSYELGYSLQKKGITFNPTLYFRRTTDDMKMLSYRQDERNTAIFTKPLNEGLEDRYGLDMNFSYDPWSWLKFMGSLNLFGYRTEGMVTYQNIDRFGNLQTRTRDFSGKGFSTIARLTSTIRFDKTFSMQLQGFYRGGQETATTKTDPMYALNMGLSKTVLDGNGTLTFNIQDIFNTRNRTMYSFNEDFDSRTYMQWMPRQFALSFTYRFKEGDKVDQPRRKKDINNNVQGGDDVPPM